MTRSILVALAFLAIAPACSVATRRHASQMTMGFALATTACDWGQTRSAASAGWKTRLEANPIMGPAPSTSRVDAYMAAAAVGTVVIGQLLVPEWARPYFYGAVGVVEANTVIGNLSTTSGLCGLSNGVTR